MQLTGCLPGDLKAIFAWFIMSMGACTPAGMLVQPANLAQAEQEALLASAFPQLPDAFRREVARQTCTGAQAVSAFGHICQARLVNPAAPLPQP